MIPPKITQLAAARSLMSAGCSPGQLEMIDAAFGCSLPEEEKALEPLMGGLMMHGYQCGALWGAALAAGARAHAVLGPGPQAELATLKACQQIATAFQERNGSLDCGDINDLEMKGLHPLRLFTHFFVRGGTIRCVKVCAGTPR